MTTSTLIRTLPATNLVGRSVKNRESQDIGEIKDLVLDLDHGKIQYAVLEFGGFMGMGSKYFAIPFEALKTKPEEKNCVLDIEKDKLENLDGFDKDNWPDFSNRKFNQSLYTHFGYQPYWN